MAPRSTDPLSHPTTNSTATLSAPSFNLALVIALGSLIPPTVIGNALVCLAFIKYRRIRTATNCFLVSLAISDLAVGFVLIPFWITLTVIGFTDKPSSLIALWKILDITCSVASMTNLTSVSIERWYGVTFPFRHMSMSTSTAFLMASFSWLYALGTGVLSLAQADWVYTAITVLGLCLPFLLMTLSYCGIARKVKQKTLDGTYPSGRECKTIRTLILLSIIFLVCWLPFITGSLVTNYCDTCANYVLQRPALVIIPKFLHYANSCINPVLYALLSPSFKSAFYQLFRGTNRELGIHRGRGLSFDHSHSGSHTRKVTLTASFKDRRTTSLVYHCKNNRGSLNGDRIADV